VVIRVVVRVVIRVVIRVIIRVVIREDGCSLSTWVVLVRLKEEERSRLIAAIATRVVFNSPFYFV
jgi:hypothetical protein